MVDVKNIAKKQRRIWEITAETMGESDLEIKKIVYEQVNRDIWKEEKKEYWQNKNKGKKENGKEEPPTGKQLSLIQQLNGDLNKCDTKDEASDYIEKLLKEKNKKDKEKGS